MCRPVMALCSVLLAACSWRDSTTAPVTPPVKRPTPTPVAPAPIVPVTGPVFVSNPQIAGGGRSIAYVSLPPQELLSGDTVVIINVRDGSVARPIVHFGGFDPVAISAVVGDTLEVQSRWASTFHMRIVVPASRPPRVIRTNPGKSTTTWSTDAAVSVVFSEPLDPASVSAGAVRLRRGLDDVAASVALDSSGTVIRLTPSAPLAPSTEYRLDVTRAPTDGAGDQLDSAITVAFTTIAAGSSAGVAALTGVWEATSWRFAEVDTGRSYGRSDDPVVGWDSINYYRIRLVITPASATSIGWRWVENWVIAGTPGTDEVTGSAIVGPDWLFGRTEQSRWLDLTTPCLYGYVCPLQGFDDFQRQADVLTITRRDSLFYVDIMGEVWRARETVTLRRIVPSP